MLAYLQTSVMVGMDDIGCGYLYYNTMMCHNKHVSAHLYAHGSQKKSSQHLIKNSQILCSS